MHSPRHPLFTSEASHASKTAGTAAEKPANASLTPIILTPPISTLFGRASLFELLPLARTPGGESRLADWLKSSSPLDELARAP